MQHTWRVVARVVVASSCARRALGSVAAPGKTKLGWVGTGVMGASMAGHCLKAGYELTVYNRTASKLQPLVSAGARVARSPREVAERSDVVLTILGYPSDVESVYLDTNTGLLAGGRDRHSVFVDLTTSEPSLARRLASVAGERGMGMLDAPVSGGDVGAREARLSVMLGGDASVVASVMPVLQCFGKNIVHLGPAGAGQHTKAVNQTLIASGMIGLVEGLLYAQRAGLDMEKVLAAVGGGAAGSWSLANYGPRILAGRLEPGFSVNHFVKDLGIVLAEAARMRLALPGLALAHQLYVSLQAQGHGQLGTHALVLALKTLSPDPPRS